MSDGEEYHVFVGNLSWNTTDRILEDAFIKFGKIANAKVVLDNSGRSRGFGFVTFDKKDVIEEAIEKMNGMDLDGRAITVDRAQPGGRRGGGSGSRDRDYDRVDRRNGGGPCGYSSSGGGGGGRSGGGGGSDCFKCGKPGHLARECPSGDGGDIFGGDRYGGGGSGDRYFGHSRDGGGCDRSAPYELCPDKNRGLYHFDDELSFHQ